MHSVKRIVSLLLCLSFLVGTLTACGSKKNYIIDPEEEKASGGSNIRSNGVDPFEGLVVEFDGVSPYCTISFNNAGCSQQVQERVSYSLRPDGVETSGFFQEGDTVTVYALTQNAGFARSSTSTEEEALTLSRESRTYTVENVPKYLTELTADMDLTRLKQEIDDQLSAITAFQSGGYLWDWSIGNGISSFACSRYQSHTAPVRGNCYFSALKRNAYSKYPEETDCFNRVNVMYSIEITAEDGVSHTRYFTIIAKNLVWNTDGTIGWGKTDPASLDLEYAIDAANMESLTNTQVTSFKDSYNVADVNALFA